MLRASQAKRFDVAGGQSPRAPSCPSAYTGGPQCTTWRARSRNPRVMTARPAVSRPSGSAAEARWKSSKSSGPAARRIAKSTRPAPAGFTMASVDSAVISPR